MNASPLPPFDPAGEHGAAVLPVTSRPVPISRPGRRPSEISNAHGRAANYSKNGGCLLFAGGSARRANAPRAEPESSNPRPWNNRCPLTRSARVFASRRNRARPRVPPRISSLRFCAAMQRSERSERKSASTYAEWKIREGRTLRSVLSCCGKQSLIDARCRNEH